MFIRLYGRAIDMTGQRFGSLTALGPVERIKRSSGTQIKWLCSCVCGSEVSVAAGDLRSGQGAAARERLTKHGKAGSAEYHVWRAANTSSNLVISAFGRTGPLASFVNTGTREYGRARERIVKLGWEPERALSDIVGAGQWP